MKSSRRGTRRPNGSFMANPFLRWIIVAIFTLFMAFPLYWMIVSSFKNGNEAYSVQPTFLPQNPTISSYISSFVSGRAQYGVTFHDFLNSIIVTTLTVVFCIALAAPAAYSFSRARLRGSSFMLLFVLVLRMVPPIVIIIPLYDIMRLFHLINTYPALIISFVGLNLPLVIWLLKGFYDGIPIDLAEAAMLDGYSHFGIFRRVYFPLSFPGVATSAILVAIGTWNDIMVTMVMARDTTRTVSMAMALLDTQFESLWAMTMATSVVSSLPVVIFALLVQKNLVRGLTMGAIR
jgi:multiple sugar transport system permease protein